MDVKINPLEDMIFSVGEGVIMLSLAPSQSQALCTFNIATNCPELLDSFHLSIQDFEGLVVFRDAVTIFFMITKSIDT